MKKLGVEDIKQLDNLTKGLKRAKFNDLSGPEILAMAFTFQWLAELKADIEQSLLPPPSPSIKSEPVKSDKKKK